MVYIKTGALTQKKEEQWKISKQAWTGMRKRSCKSWTCGGWLASMSPGNSWCVPAPSAGTGNFGVSVYSYRHPQISCEVSLSLAVPACRTDEVEGYLASANGPIDGSGFYLYPSTGNIVFSCVYDISGTGADPDTGSFTTFCHLACDMFSRH